MIIKKIHQEIETELFDLGECRTFKSVQLSCGLVSVKLTMYYSPKQQTLNLEKQEELKILNRPRTTFHQF